MNEEEDDSHLSKRRWERLPSDILQKVLVESDFNDTSGMTSLISQVHCGAVCTAWRLLLTDPQLWHTIDLSSMKSNFIDTRGHPYVYVTEKSDLILNCFLKSATSHSKGCTTRLILHPNLYLPNDLFTYAAERSPKLKRLVMPAWNRIDKDGIRMAIACWKDLESLTIEYISDGIFSYLIHEISNNCKNFRELKLMTASDSQITSIVNASLKLKVLSLRCSNVLQEHLTAILDRFCDLEVLNISHCRVMEALRPDRPDGRRVLSELDPLILEKVSRLKKLKKFMTCMPFDGWCIMCDRARNDEGYMKWYKYEPELWKQDEVDSLAL
uniref:F-box/LRR-repeat protein At3g48880-like isoform X1 n=1 Tax=Fragaria vesca subsp. vesca TaxID=101020 RepID=UPI0005C9CD6D|nr:PREDICTED: F-box/LRR-repeat protein At3g48880-like isoform X1 [Fragaria vesca subsp. vesca]XP_011470381.1 PREDICTED: F-box/LRR-repeat protein At3g48880-like isoform X1 [Fragaria vesca subsp. vesca]XP_011470382.1 PREDICTED: F-box/LRR-repeat protein At3g48880-like isoform X1 [Fragaria vesca subsp. vesca]XP_011470384.1 PREDICTED: F-box/LRR-repeat protein At3g48880-like isoform X1 [Fragaria vesca subsp. vesca]XP_011470385.1 PREDICTED: F-box/LRR-repeat protein At3g48880-like isoform X1 [Fragaria 